MSDIIYIGIDNDVILDEWKNSRTGAYVNSGTVSFTLYRLLCKDAVTIASSTIISSVGLPFVSGDAARSVVVLGAVANGGDLRTTIATYTDTGHVVLTAAPSASTTHTEVRVSVTDATAITMSYVTDSNGKYRGIIDDDVVLQNGAPYWIEVMGDAGGDVKDFRVMDVIAQYRK